VAIAAGQYHTCAALSDGSLKCWGDGSYGRLGLESLWAYGYAPGQMGDNLPAVNLGTGEQVAANITALDATSCALLRDGSVKCWGDGSAGQLGFPASIAGNQPGTMGDNLPTVKLFSYQW
jgi:alpha-tubulin suppressor-like RCC1 family protein